MSARGPHPADADLFSAEHLPVLRAAAADLSWLYDRGYAETSSVDLVGDRYQLHKRQRDAVRRGSCGDRVRDERNHRRVSSWRGERVAIDAFNQVITGETALSGGVVFRGRDGVCRDLAGVHGTWRRGTRSQEVITAIGEALEEGGVGDVLWIVDRPVSNSGRLADMVRTIAAEHGWSWEAEVVADADPVLIASEHVVVSSDGHVLDGCARWTEVLSVIFDPETWVVDLGDGDGSSAAND